MAEVRRPPVLRVRHHRLDVLLQRSEIERLELFGVVERLAHRIRRRVVRVEGVQVQLIRPPVAVRPPLCAWPKTGSFFLVHGDRDLVLTIGVQSGYQSGFS
jgi:hypothetical protein